MSNQSTRASEPPADPRQPFTLSKAEDERLQELGTLAYATPDGVDALNAYWAELGTTHGFTWTTVADLANPTQSHLVHDGLREARQDGETAALAGWHAAMMAVRELVQSGRAQAGSAIPPLVLLDRLGEIEVPEDMDEMFNPWRGLGEAFTRLAELRGPRPDFMPEATWNNLSHLNWAIQAAQVAKDWLARTEWVQHEMQRGSDRIPDTVLGQALGRDRLATVIAALDWWKGAAMHMAGEGLDRNAWPFERGTHVRKVQGHDFGSGKAKVAVCYRTLHDNTWRVVGEHPEGWQFIFTPGQIEVTPEPAATVRTIEEAVAAGLIPGLAQEDLDAIRLARDTDVNGPHGDEEPQPVPGVYSPNQSSTRYPAAEGLECMGRPEGEA